MSCAYNFLSNEIEALIACMMAAGPEAKRPPHIWLLAFSSLIMVTGRWSSTWQMEEKWCPPGAPC